MGAFMAVEGRETPACEKFMVSVAAAFGGRLRESADVSGQWRG
jgi:hypothetical protein